MKIETKDNEIIRRIIVCEAVQLLEGYLSKEDKIGSAQWKKFYQEKAIALLWRCHSQQIYVPKEVILLVQELIGKRHVWNEAKWKVLDFIAENCNPHPNFQISVSVKVEAAEIIAKHGGLLKKPRKSNARSRYRKKEHNYERTIENWLQEDLFTQLWSLKYYAHQENNN